jgi:hypothetical protein
MVDNITELFYGSAFNRLSYFSWGTGNDQSALLPEANIGQ